MQRRRRNDEVKKNKKKLAALSMLHKAKKAYYACDVIRFLVPKRHDVMLFWSRSPGCADVLRGARAHVTDFSYMTLMDKSAVKHNMLKEEEEEKKMEEKKDEIEKKKMNKQKKAE